MTHKEALKRANRKPFKVNWLYFVVFVLGLVIGGNLTLQAVRTENDLLEVSR